jgi:hypothetical protein
MPLRFPSPGIDGFRHISYLAADHFDNPVIVSVTLEAQHRHGELAAKKNASEKFDAGLADRSCGLPKIEVRTTDFPKSMDGQIEAARFFRSVL